MKGTSKLPSRHLSADRPLQRLRGCFLGDNAAVPPAYRVKVQKCASFVDILDVCKFTTFCDRKGYIGNQNVSTVGVQPCVSHVQKYQALALPNPPSATYSRVERSCLQIVCARTFFSKFISIFITLIHIYILYGARTCVRLAQELTVRLRYILCAVVCTRRRHQA